MTGPYQFVVHSHELYNVGHMYEAAIAYRFVDPSAESFRLSVNGRPVDAQVALGFAVLDRQWKDGDRVDLSLPMPVRVSECHPAVKANRGRVALTRGPLVLCAEGVDNGGAVQRLFFANRPDTSKTEVTRKRLRAGSFLQVRMPADALTATGGTEKTRLVLTPYYAWNNRGVSSMSIWFPRTKEAAVFDPTARPRR